ncbi:MAG TPA: DUF5117 domain-containing protein, partial [Cyclobacteriaceae bacterium]|nr:DUF5117 domain-containing protein [Cyclobacteriaceae bacterium]
MMRTFTFFIGLVLCFAIALPASAQKSKKKDDKKATPVAPVKADTTKAKGPATPGPKPYKQVITAKAKTQKGLFTVHKINEDYFMEIPDSIMGREFMAITRMAKAPAGAGYGGEEQNRQVLRWERGPNNKLFLRAVLTINTSPDEDKPITQAVRNSNVEPIAASFDIKAIRKDTSYVINVTDFFKGDNLLISL